MERHTAVRWAGAWIWALCSIAQAQIVIGQTSGFTGPVASGVKENTEGAKLVIDEVNRSGGIRGQRVELVSLDDKFDPKLAAENARQLIVDKRAVAIFLNRGTPHSEAIKPLLGQYKVPLVAPSTGAMVLHQPVHPWIFNVRATYQREAEKAVHHLVTLGVTRLALVHVDDSFGADGAAGADKGLAASKLQPVLRATFDRSKPVLAPIVNGIIEKDAQAVLFFGSAGSVAEGVKLMRERGSRAQVVTLSNNASAGFVKLLGEHARGVIVTQVFPSERAVQVPLIKEAQDLARAKGLTLTPAMMEGYAAARVLVLGLRKAAPTITGTSLAAAFESLGRVDLGGMELNYSPSDHSGLDYADLSIIGPDGRFVR